MPPVRGGPPDVILGSIPSDQFGSEGATILATSGSDFLSLSCFLT